MKKIIPLLLVSLLFLISNQVKAEETTTRFENILHEDFEKVQHAFWDETIFWANNGNITTTNQEIIDGTSSLKFVPSTIIGNWTDLGGTSINELTMQDGTYQISLKIKAQDVNFLAIKVNNKNDETYYEFLLNPLTGEKLNSNGQVVDVIEDEFLSIDQNIVTVRFTFDALNNINSYLALTSKTSGNNPYVVIDDIGVKKATKELNYRVISEDNFDNSQGEIHTSSLFWVNNDEGTTASFTEIQGEAIEDKSLSYQIDKNGWDILGGSQGDKLNISGGQSYRISFDVRLINTSYLSIKLMTISTPEIVLYDMYINDQGKRLPGSMPISREESVVENDGVITVSFTFSSDMSNNAYIYLNAYGNGEGSQVILDNLKIEEEIVDIPYITYTDDYVQDFEEDISGLVEGHDCDTLSLIQDELVIKGEQSLKIEPANKFRWNNILKTDSNVEINDDQFKVHFKSRFYDIGQVKIQILKQNDEEVIHEFNFDAKSLKRIQGIGDGYLDSGNLSTHNGIVVGYFELPELEVNTQYYVNINVFPLSDDAYVVIDDFNILKQLPTQPIKEDLFTRPGDIVPTDDELPTGEGATIESSYINQIDFTGIGITAVVFVTVLIIGIIMIRIVFNKDGHQNGPKMILFILILSIMTFVTGYFTISPKKTVEDVIKMKDINDEDYHVVYPEKIRGHLKNPGMGWVSLEEPTYGGHPDLGASGNLPEVDNISISTSWARIEKMEGVYDFTLIDQVIDYYTALGKHINLRISTDSLMLPNTYQGVPNWLIEKYNIPYETVNYTDPGPVSTFKSIDLRDPNYLRYLDLFLNALADKYKDNPYVDVVEIRGFGNWGEWHSGYPFDTVENRMNTLANIINHYVDAFSESGKLMVLSAAWDPYFTPYDSYQDYVSYSAFDYLMTLPNATFRRDSGGNLLNYNTDERLLSDFFRSGKRLPLLGEYASGIDAALNASYGFDLMGGINDILFKMRPNYSTVLGWVNMNAAWLIENGYSELFERGNEKMGYRLAVDMARYPKEVAPGNEFTLMTSFSNSGVGRFWYEYPLKIHILDENNDEVTSYINNEFDARTFILGEINNVYSNITIPSYLDEGTYKIAVSIIDDEGNDAIKLGMAGEIEDSKRYVLGNINVSNSASHIDDLSHKTTYDQIDDFDFKPNTTYMLTFKYQPEFDMRNYKFGSNDGYVFALTSKNGGEGATVGYHKWQDISGEPGFKTMVFTTQDYKDYKLNIKSEGFDSIEVTDIYIEKMGGYYEHFENYDFTDEHSIYYPINTKNAYITNKEDEVITGNTSVVINTKSKGDVDGLKIDTNVFPLKPNTTYTLSFKFQNLSMVGKGGYMYLNLFDELTNTSTRISEWYERDDLYFTNKTFTFTTSESTKQTIVFGLHNGGKYAIDDLILTEQAKGDIIEGTDIESPRNEVPQHDLGGIGEVEDFEDSSFNSCSFDWGYFGWGQFTFNPEFVISGNSSLMGQVENEAVDNEWFEFAHSKLEAYEFKPNTTYTLEFKYRIINNPINDGRFYVLFRSNSLGYSEDVGYQALPVLSQDELGQIKTFTKDVTIGNAEDYKLVFGMHWLGTIVIDDVLITEKTNE